MEKEGRISTTELKTKYQEIIARVAKPEDRQSFSQAVLECVKWAADNFDSLDDEAQRGVDELIATLKDGFGTAVAALPDGPQKRAMRRLVAAGGQHLNASSLANTLIGETKHDGELVQFPAKTFLTILQHILDLLFDVTSVSVSGPAEISNLALAYAAVDELIVGFYLAQRAFVTQAYSHIRTVQEITDKMTLFHKQPHWTQLWASGDERKVYRELKPSQVRKKLGNPPFDPLYSFFSSLGPHGTFESVQVRMVKEATQAGEPADRTKVRISVGGDTPFKKHIVWVNTFCTYSSACLLGTIGEVFSKHLNADELKTKLSAAWKEQNRLIKNYFIAWAEKEGVQTAKFLEMLSQNPFAPDDEAESAAAPAS